MKSSLLKSFWVLLPTSTHYTIREASLPQGKRNSKIMLQDESFLTVINCLETSNSRILKYLIISNACKTNGKKNHSEN